jgi:hypothetical protein
MGSLPVLNVRRFRLNLKIGLHACHLPRRTLFFRHMKRHEVSHSCLSLNHMSTADKVSRLIRINFKRTSFLLLRARRSFPLLWFGSHFPATGLTIVPLRYGPRMHASMDCMIDYSHKRVINYSNCRLLALSPPSPPKKMTLETMISSSTSSTSNNNSDLKKLGKLSSVLLLIGACLWFVALAMGDAIGDVLEKILYGTAFGCLILHVLPQVILDLRYPQRPLPHSRYGTWSRRINLLQSALFTVGTFFQSVSYWSWISHDDDSDHYTSLNIAGAFVWLASAILIALFQGCCCCANMENAKQSGLHRVGNTIYIITTVIFVLAGYVWRDQPNDFLGFFLQCLCILLLILVGILYVAGDIRGIPPTKPPRSEAPTSEAEVPTSSERSI